MEHEPTPCRKCSGRGHYLMLTVKIECYHCNGDGWEAVCKVCGGPVHPNADKYDPKRPVYDEDEGGMYHLGCEGEVFEEVCCSIATDTEDNGN